ncbi:GntR family transcriptional regulator [Brevibacterium luteolum]|uniref:GntR family transcriptional regulator n=1 Tax=Brevibacterium luteolum TaxID=199591 RepID=UPI0014780847|nr:DNA-binding FadR family transcriptional regulator [Brevibacterium luteolum]
MRRRIRRAVQLGFLSTGDRLPSESEMANAFGVAAGAVREALAALRSEGIVTTRRGRSGGTFIVGIPGFRIDEVKKDLAAMSMAELRDLSDELTAIARASADLAAERAYEDDIDKLRRLAAVFADTAEPTAQAMADSRFHVELTAMSQSSRLTQAQLRLQSEFAELLWCSGTVDAAREARDHAAIIDAVAQGRSGRAGDAVAVHIRAALRTIVEFKLSLLPEVA